MVLDVRSKSMAAELFDRGFHDLAIGQMTELADRVRPSEARPGRTEVPPEEASEPAAEDSANEDSAVAVDSPSEAALAVEG